jgi:hypothetical protein
MRFHAIVAAPGDDGLRRRQQVAGDQEGAQAGLPRQGQGATAAACQHQNRDGAASGTGRRDVVHPVADDADAVKGHAQASAGLNEQAGLRLATGAAF